MEVIGYFAAGLIGISLGLIGAGGGILTVPMMVYFFSIPMGLSTSYSLFIVGTTSMVGAGLQIRQQNVHFKTALLFGLTSITVVSLVRMFIVPVIPHNLFVVNGIAIRSSMVSMVLFSLLMIIAASLMFKKSAVRIIPPTNRNGAIYLQLIYGCIVGLITGLLGAGGGFLLVPTLVLLMHFRMKEAIGTSLLIIALNCLIGFSIDLHHFNIEWKFLGTIVTIACIGIYPGAAIGKKVSGEELKKSFGLLLLILGVIILFVELLKFFEQVNTNVIKAA